MQSRTASLIETVTSLIVGFALSILVGHFVFPLFGHAFSLTDNFWITTIYTVVSFVRSYAMRRGFNLLYQRGILQ